jgi:LacI family transcriptional regulator
MENITLKRISEVLNLSISTVSRALKNHPDISTATKKRVNELAQSLDYEPNINAINLRAKKNRVLALIVPTIAGFFYSSFISAVEEECRANDYTLIILQSGNDPETEKNNLSVCRQNRISGLFVCLSTNTANMAAFDKFNEADIPLIFFDKVPEADVYNKICVADEEAARLAAQLLIENKKQNILALFGNKNLSITKSRLKSFTDTMAKQQKIINHFEHCSNFTEAKNITTEYFSKKTFPDAVFCMSDEILIGVMKSLQDLKIPIPEKAAVIALSDGFWPQLYSPEITYIETSGYKLGKLAFTRMMNCMEGKTKPVEMFINSPVIKGGSL